MTTTVTEQFDCTAPELWALLGDFEGIDGVFPAVTDVTTTPKERTFTLLGMRITEELRGRDDAARTLTYSIVSGIDVEQHSATIEVLDEGTGSVARWSVTAVPEAAEPLFSDTYQRALSDLRKRLAEGTPTAAS